MGKKADSLKELTAPDEWELVESIGEGTYGEVYKARNKITREIAAAKVIDSIHEKIEEVLPELDILKKYSTHPNIAGFHGAFINVDTKRHDQLWLVMEVGVYLLKTLLVCLMLKSSKEENKYLQNVKSGAVFYRFKLDRYNVIYLLPLK